MFRALGILRVVLLANTVGLNLYRADNFERPLAGLVCVLVMIVWTAIALAAYADPARRRAWLLGVDLLVTVVLLAVSPVVKGTDFNASVPGFWSVCVILAWAIHYHWRGGLVASAFVAATDLVVRDHITLTKYGNVFLLLV
ncbi:MAG: DUF5931 domain-containing protein, partial [Nocardioides sp.]|nr:DUF5931 domain-containing protein [Nocardioides sp.]